MLKNLESIDVESFLCRAQTVPVIDVRSPGEYEQGHIPGAINIPIFSNEERARVGIKYKRAGRQSAVILGLEIVGPKLSVFVRRVKKIVGHGEVLVYCWRGGMRSNSMAQLFSTAGFKSQILDGGYKSYRRHIRSRFAVPANIVVLGGMTGSGKTEVLHHLISLKQQVLDLEGIANHKGSAFGGLGQAPQPTTEQYENDLFEVWKDFDLVKPIWVEDESHAVGSVWINPPLFEQMRSAPVIKIEMPREERVRRLVREYAGFDIEIGKGIIQRIGRRLGGQNVKLAFELMDKGDFASVAEITLRYYDKTYEYGLEQRSNQTVYPIVLNKDIPDENARRVLEFSYTIVERDL